jgi:hypothetical protein
LARKRKKKSRSGRLERRGASKAGTPAAKSASDPETAPEISAPPPLQQIPAETTSAEPNDAPSAQSPPEGVPGGGGEPLERMPASALAVTLPDVSEAEIEASGELWKSHRRQPEPELPAVEVHPENPDAAPVVSGVIQGFTAVADPKARASSTLTVDFGATGEPSIQIEQTYEQDTHKLLDPEDPGATAARVPTSPGRIPAPFNGDTDEVKTQPTFEEPHTAEVVPVAEVLPSAEVVPVAEELPSAEVDDVSDDESLPVYAVAQADQPLVEVPEEAPKEVPKGPDPVSDAVPPAALDPKPKEQEAPASFQPAGFVTTTPKESAPAEETAEREPPKVAGVPTLSLPSRTTPQEPTPTPPGAPATAVAGIVTGVIGGAIVVTPSLNQQQDAGLPLTASGSIIIDPDLLVAEQAATEEAAAEEAAAQKAAAEEAAAEEAAAEEAAAEEAAAQKAAAEEAAAEKAAAEKTAAEKTAAEETAAEEAATEKAAAEEAAAEEAAAEEAAAEKAAAEKAAAEKAAAEEAATEKAAAEEAAAEEAAAEKAAAEKATAEEAAAEKTAAEKTASPGNSMAASIRYELSESFEPAAQQKTPDAPRSRPPAVARPKPPAPISKANAFSDLEIAFFEQDLQKVEEVDTFDDLVADLPDPETPWGILFGKPKGKPKAKASKRPEPNLQAADDRPKMIPRPPKKRK